MASNQPPFGTGSTPGRRKRQQTDDSTSQVSLSSYFANTPPPGSPAPPRFDLTPSTQDQDEQPQGYLSAFADEKAYSNFYSPRLDYLNPSIVPEDSHNKMDMNYISWAIRHAITASLVAVIAAQETVIKEQKNQAMMIQALHRKLILIADTETLLKRAVEHIDKNIAQAIHPLLFMDRLVQSLVMEELD